MTTLTERLSASEPSRENDGLIAIYLRPGFYPSVQIAEKDSPNYTTSLDAALGLVPEGIAVSMTIFENGKAWADLGGPYSGLFKRSGEVATLPLAICIVSLMAQEQADG